MLFLIHARNEQLVSRDCLLRCMIVVENTDFESFLFFYICAENSIGNDGAQALGKSLERNTSLLQLSLTGTS